jgi:methyl-accepting chemotaxis protein
MQTAATVAQNITSAEVKAMAAALKDLDYSKLAIKPELLASIDTGTLKLRQLRGEVNAITTSFKALDSTGLEKITKGIARLSEEFESFNNRFTIDFMGVFKKLDRDTQSALLSQLNDKMDQLNSNAQRLIEVEEEVAENTKSISGKTGTNMAKK